MLEGEEIRMSIPWTENADCPGEDLEEANLSFPAHTPHVAEPETPRGTARSLSTGGAWLFIYFF